MVTGGGKDPGGEGGGVVQEGGAGSPSIRHHRNGSTGTLAASLHCLLFWQNNMKWKS